MNKKIANPSTFDSDSLNHQMPVDDNSANHGLQRFALEMERYNNRRFFNSKKLRPLPKGRIAIARNFGIVLNDDGHITLLGKNDEFRQIQALYPIVKVAASFSDYMALNNRGMVFLGGKTYEIGKYPAVESLCDIIDVVSCEGHTVVIFSDRSVRSIDESGGCEIVPQHAEVVRNWRNIKQVAAGYSNIMGLTADGKVIYHRGYGNTDRNPYDRLDDVVQIDCYSHYYGPDLSMALRSDGTVVSDSFEGVGRWRDIIQISVGADIAIGLKKDGTLEVVEKSERGSRADIRQWKDIISIECKFFDVIGITRHGEILSTYR